MVKAAAVSQSEKDSRDIRRLRLSAGIRSFCAVAFAFIALAAAAVIADLMWYRRALSSSSGGLSPRTAELLNDANGNLEITAIFADDGSDASSDPSGFSFSDARRLMSAVERAVSGRPNQRAEFIHIGENPAGAADALRRHPGAIPNSIVVACGGNVQIVDALDLADQSGAVGAMLPGEAALCRAVEHVAKPRSGAVYFVSGHGEYSVGDENPVTGASSFGHALEASGFTVHDFSPDGGELPPKNCRLLVVAGPRLMFSPLEVETISRYLANGGRALILLDNARNVSLSALLEHWNVKAEDIPGRRQSAVLKTSRYSESHEATAGLSGIVSVWTAPCGVSELSAEDGSAASVTELVYVKGPAGEGEKSVAVAVSAAGAGRAKSRSTRIVVCGDADILSNAVYDRKPEGNAVFLSRLVDWLVAPDKGSSK